MKLVIKHRFSSVKADWERLYKLTPEVSPFMHPGAFAIAYRYFYPYYLIWRTIPTFAVFTDDVKVRAIVPLLKSKGKNRLFGDVNGFNECGILYDDCAILPQVISLLHKRFGEVEFMKIDERSPVSSYKGSTAKESKNVAIRFDDSFDEYFKVLSKSVRQNIRTAYNRLNTDGLLLSMKYFKPDIAVREDVPINQLVDLYVKRHAERYGVATGRLKQWFLKHQSFATRYYIKAPNAFTSVLYINSEIVGFLSGLYDDKTIIVPRLSIDSEFRRYSPGLVLICETIKYLQQNTSIRCLDLSLGEEQYKYQLGGRSHLAYRFNI
jgi:hypothetical protein